VQRLEREKEIPPPEERFSLSDKYSQSCFRDPQHRVIYQDVIVWAFFGPGGTIGLQAAWFNLPPVSATIGFCRSRRSSLSRLFPKEGVDIVVRFTDADEGRWQD